MELFCGNSQHVKAIDYFCRRAPLWMFDRKFDMILNVGIKTRRRCKEKLSTTGVIQGNLGLPLPPNSLDLHHQQKGLIYDVDQANTCH